MRRALAGHPGVHDVAVKGEGDVVDVTYVPAETSVTLLCRQLMETVVLPGVRNLLGSEPSFPMA